MVGRRQTGKYEGRLAVFAGFATVAGTKPGASGHLATPISLHISTEQAPEVITANKTLASSRLS